MLVPFPVIGSGMATTLTGGNWTIASAREASDGTGWLDCAVSVFNVSSAAQILEDQASRQRVHSNNSKPTKLYPVDQREAIFNGGMSIVTIFRKGRL